MEDLSYLLSCASTPHVFFYLVHIHHWHLFFISIIFIMRFLIISTIALLATSAVGKKCINATVPVTITARTADFNVPIPHTNLDVTTFIQNNSRQGSNFTKQALLGYCTRKETYHISTQFCTPDEPTAASQTLQILTHGIGFDKT